MSLTRAYLRQVVEIEIVADPDEEHPNDFMRFETEQELQDFMTRMNNGSIWLWCQARVEVYFQDFWMGRAVLGGCSYESEEDFVQNSGYYDDLVEDAIADLENNLLAHMYVFVYNNPQED